MTIITKLLNFLQKWFTGQHSIKIPMINRYLIFPKLAPLMIIAFSLAFYGDNNQYVMLSLLGYSLLILGIFCFLMLKIFPKREKNGLTK